MVRKRLNRNIDASAIVDLPEINDEVQQIKNDVATNTQDITQLKETVENHTNEIDQLEQELARFDNYYTKPEIDEKVEQLEAEIGNHYTKPESDEKFATKTQLEEANTQIAQNQQSIETLETNTAKKNEHNDFSQSNTFNNYVEINGDVSILNDRQFRLGWTNDDLKLVCSIESQTKNVFVENPQGRITFRTPNSNIVLQPREQVNVSNKPIVNLPLPNNATDAANKQYVDNFILTLPSNQEVVYQGMKFNNKTTYIQFVDKNVATSNNQEIVKTNLINTKITDFGPCSLFAVINQHTLMPFITDNMDGFVNLVWEGGNFKIKSKNCGRTTVRIYGVITYCK